jgi:predicted transcriptional regulator
METTLSRHDHQQLLHETSAIVRAVIEGRTIANSDVPTLIAETYKALADTHPSPAITAAVPEPAVAVRSSVKHDYLVCLEDGKKLKMLKRYLRTNFNMTPEEYRAKWNLPRDYPMVAPAYAEQRRGIARATGLGLKKVAPHKPAGRRAA